MNTDAIIGKWKEEIRNSSTKSDLNITEGSRMDKKDQPILPDDDDEEPEIKEYTKFVTACLKSMAMQPIFIKNSNWFLDAINLFYIMFVNFTSFHIMLFSFADVFFSWDGNIFGLTFKIIVTSVYATNTILLLYFQYYWKYLFNLLEGLNNTFRFRSAHGLTVLNMTASFRLARLLSYIFTGACITGIAHWAVVPIFTPAMDGARVLPIELWYPVDVQKTPYYEIAYFFQFFGQLMTGMVYAIFVILFLSICVLICGQFDILCCSLRNIRFTALRRRGYPTSSLVELAGYSLEGANRCTLPEDEYKQYISGKPKILDPRLQINMQRFLDPSIDDADVVKTDHKVEMNNRSVNVDANIRRRASFKEERSDFAMNVNKSDAYEEYRMEVTEVIKDCVRHHQEILDYCQRFGKFFSPISMVKMVEITILACFLMYSLKMSAMVAQAACSGPWHVMDRKTYNNLVPLILRASRPVSFTGGSFYILSLENMISVLKASFSYYTVLRNVDEARS